MFDALITQPLTNILVIVYHILHGIGIPYALGFSIIGLTLLIRFALYPIMNSQMKASKKMQEIQPHLNRLKDQHKNDAQKLQQETMKLYKEFGVNPVAGCLPMLIQLPVIWGLYGVLGNTVKATSYQVINKLIYSDALKLHSMWDTHFFGLSLAQAPDVLKHPGPLVLVPIVTGLLQFIQSKMMFKTAPATVKDSKKKGGDFATAMQTQSTYLFPIMIGFFSNSFPLGLSLYWNTFTIFGIIQQYFINKSSDNKQAVVSKTNKNKK